MFIELKKFIVQPILVLDYKERNDHEIFHSSAKLIASDSDIDEAFKSMHEIIMTKIKNYSCKDRVVLDVLWSKVLRFLGVSIRRINNTQILGQQVILCRLNLLFSVNMSNNC